MDLSLSQLSAEVRARVSALGYEVWDVRSGGTKHRVVLQVRIDRPDAVPGQGITVRECADVSRSLEAWLDQSQLLGPRYRLEVSSPGIERPLRWPEHWSRFTGHQVRLRLPGRGRVTATIVEVRREPDVVLLRPAGESGTITVPLEDCREATLVVDWSAIGRRRPTRSS